MQGNHAQLLHAIQELTNTSHESALLLIGDVGAGKSTILEQAHRLHPESTALVRISSDEASWPMSGLAAVLSGMGDSELVRRVRLLSAPADAGDVVTAVSTLLTLLRAHERPPMTVLVDNIDLLDTASTMLLGHLCGHLTGTGLRLVATALAPPTEGPLAVVPWLVIGPPDEASLERLAPRFAHRGTLRMLNWSTARNPGELVARLAELDDEQLAGREPLAFPLRAGRVARAHAAHVLAMLTPHQTAMVDLLALSPLHARTTIEAAVEHGSDTLHELLERGVAHERGGYVHLSNGLLRSEAATSLTAEYGRLLHTRLRALAAPLVEPWHANMLSAPREHRRALVRSAIQLVDLGHAYAAVEFADRALLSGRGGLTADLAELADRLMLAGELALADRTLSLAEVESDDVAATTRGRSRLAFTTGHVSARVDHELFAVDAPAAATGSASAPPSDPPLIAAATRRAIFAEDYVGTRVLLRSLVTAPVRPSRVWAGWVAALGIECAVRAGYYDTAFELARGWAASGPVTEGPGSFIPLTVWVRLAELDTPGARTLLAEWTSNATARAGALPAAIGLTLEAGLARFEGDTGHALELLHLADAIVPADSDPSHSRHLVDLIPALMEAGNSERARDALTRLEGVASRYPSRWATLALARARIATAPPDEALEAVDRALELPTRTDSPFEKGALLQTAGSALRRLGETTRAEQCAADARVAFANAGALSWMNRGTSHLSLAAGTGAGAGAGAEVSDAVSSRALLGALSVDELRVVELVENGLQNKEIAQRLFVSVRTVELRLTHIYRKVGARSRSHLVSLLR